MVVEAEITYATRSQSPVKRFFLIAALFDTVIRSQSTDISVIPIITDGVFPSITLIKKEFMDQKRLVVHSILNIFEFNNESDFNQFIGE